MNLKITIPEFLKRKLLEQGLSLKSLSLQSKVHYQTIKNLHLGLKSNPDINTLIKVANFFKCSLDEVVGRNPKYFLYNKTKYYNYDLDSIQVSQNLKKFILQKNIDHNTNLNRLSINIGFSSGLLSDFIREERPMKSLSTLSVYKLADYFNISIDQMIGRVHFTEDNSDPNDTNSY